MLRPRKHPVPPDERWRLGREELFRLQEPGFFSHPWVARVALAITAGCLFTLTLLCSGTLQVSQTGYAVQDIVGELRAIHVGASQFGSDPLTATARGVIQESLGRLEALANRVQSEVRLDAAYRTRLLAQIHNEWLWWRAVLDGETGMAPLPPPEIPAKPRKR